MMLSDELKQANYDYIRRQIPEFAEDIIAEQSAIKRRLIQKIICIDKVPTYPGKFAWQDFACIYSDEDDAISLCFILKNKISAGFHLTSFRQIGIAYET